MQTELISAPKIGNGGVSYLSDDGQGKQRVRVTGTITSIVFRNEEDDWSVLTVVAGKTKLRVTGHTAAQEGQEITAEGSLFNRKATSQWKNEITEELKAERIVATSPRTPQGIAAYLAANVRGVGPVLARRLARSFEGGLFEVLENEPDKLASIKGVTPAVMSGIQKTWAEQKSVAEIMLFLHDQTLSPATCRRIHKAYGDRTREILQDNPYRLAQDVRGIGFLKADEIAGKLGVPKSSPYRIRAGLMHALDDATTKGHCGLKRHDMMRLTAELLGVSEALMENGLRLLVAEEHSPVVEDRGAIWLRRLYNAQVSIAKRLLAAASRAPKWSARIKDVELAIADAEKRASIKLADAQREAVRMALRSQVCIITGGPGCGKTTTLNVVLDVMRAHRVKVELAAPTGKAAQRASQATGVTAATLHRLLKIGSDGPALEIAPDALVVDESSMVDVPLMLNVLDGLDEDSALIIVGDVDQLPSVGPGSVLADLIDSKKVPSTKLTVVYRQGKGSLIVENAHTVNSGYVPSAQRGDGDFFFVNEKRDQRLLDAMAKNEPGAVSIAAREILVELVTQRLPSRYGFDPIADIMVLSPMNNGNCGVRTLNPTLQAALNPRADDEVWRFGDTRFGIGDKVIQTRNNYDLNVFNGDTGRILQINREAKHLLIDYDGRLVEHPFEDVDELRLAYCMTVHKSQGSQSPCVVIPMLTEHFSMLQRNLLYTGITRAQKLCVLLGTTKAVAMAVNRTDANQRLTLLKDFLTYEPKFVSQAL